MTRPAADLTAAAHLARLRVNDEMPLALDVLGYAERVLAESGNPAALLADPYTVIGRLQGALDVLLDPDAWPDPDDADGPS